MMALMRVAGGLLIGGAISCIICPIGGAIMGAVGALSLVIAVAMERKLEHEAEAAARKYYPPYGY